MHRPLPDLPWVSAFPELNVRVYVEKDEKPGVWFLSLDATNPLAVVAARALFDLPYYRSAMSVTAVGEDIQYDAIRYRSGHAFRALYGPSSEPYLAKPGSVEHWLTERYCLYAADEYGQLFRTDVHHIPWPLQKAHAEIERCSMTPLVGAERVGRPDLLHFSRRLDVVVWNPTLVCAS